MMKKLIVSTVFILAGTFAPSLAEETGGHGHRSLRGSEHEANGSGGGAARGGRVLEENTVGIYLMVRLLVKFALGRVPVHGQTARCGAASLRPP